MQQEAVKFNQDIDQELLNEAKNAIINAKIGDINPLLLLIKNPDFHIKYIKQLGLNDKDGMEIMKGICSQNLGCKFLYVAFTDFEIFNFLLKGNILTQNSFKVLIDNILKTNSADSLFSSLLCDPKYLEKESKLGDLNHQQLLQFINKQKLNSSISIKYLFEKKIIDKNLFQELLPKQQNWLLSSMQSQSKVQQLEGEQILNIFNSLLSLEPSQLNDFLKNFNLNFDQMVETLINEGMTSNLLQLINFNRNKIVYENVTQFSRIENLNMFDLFIQNTILTKENFIYLINNSSNTEILTQDVLMWEKISQNGNVNENFMNNLKVFQKNNLKQKLEIEIQQNQDLLNELENAKKNVESRIAFLKEGGEIFEEPEITIFANINDSIINNYVPKNQQIQNENIIDNQNIILDYKKFDDFSQYSDSDLIEDLLENKNEQKQYLSQDSTEASITQDLFLKSKECYKMNTAELGLLLSDITNKIDSIKERNNFLKNNFISNNNDNSQTKQCISISEITQILEDKINKNKIDRKNVKKNNITVAENYIQTSKIYYETISKSSPQFLQYAGLFEIINTKRNENPIVDQFYLQGNLTQDLIENKKEQLTQEANSVIIGRLIQIQNMINSQEFINFYKGENLENRDEKKDLIDLLQIELQELRQEIAKFIQQNQNIEAINEDDSLLFKILNQHNAGMKRMILENFEQQELLDVLNTKHPEKKLYQILDCSSMYLKMNKIARLMEEIGSRDWHNYSKMSDYPAYLMYAEPAQQIRLLSIEQFNELQDKFQNEFQAFHEKLEKILETHQEALYLEDEVVFLKNQKNEKVSFSWKIEQQLLKGKELKDKIKDSINEKFLIQGKEFGDKIKTISEQLQNKTTYFMNIFKKDQIQQQQDNQEQKKIELEQKINNNQGQKDSQKQ